VGIHMAAGTGQDTEIHVVDMWMQAMY
jgi:hypothetical protein